MVSKIDVIVYNDKLNENRVPDVIVYQTVTYIDDYTPISSIPRAIPLHSRVSRSDSIVQIRIFNFHASNFSRYDSDTYNRELTQDIITRRMWNKSVDFLYVPTTSVSYRSPHYFQRESVFFRQKVWPLLRRQSEKEDGKSSMINAHMRVSVHIPKVNESWRAAGKGDGEKAPKERRAFDL